MENLDPKAVPVQSDLAALAGVAASADAIGAPDPIPGAPGEISEVSQAINYATEAAQSVDMFAALVTGYAPACVQIWTDHTKAAIAAALAPVLEKYQMTLGGLPVEIALLIVAGPPLYQSSKLIAAKIAQDKAIAAQTAQSVTAQPVARAVTQPIETPQNEVHPQVALYRNGGTV